MPLPSTRGIVLLHCVLAFARTSVLRVYRKRQEHTGHRRFIVVGVLTMFILGSDGDRQAIAAVVRRAEQEDYVAGRGALASQEQLSCARMGSKKCNTQAGVFLHSLHLAVSMPAERI